MLFSLDNSEIQPESVDDQTDERDPELGVKSSSGAEACASLGCLSPLASTDALLPSFQPDDDDSAKSPQPSPMAEQRNYPQFATKRNRSPRSDEMYAGSVSYAGHSPRLEVATSIPRRPSYSERSSPRGSGVVVEDLTSHAKPGWTIAEASHGDQQNAGSGVVGREIVRSNMDRQSRQSPTNRVSCCHVHAAQSIEIRDDVSLKTSLSCFMNLHFVNIFFSQS